MVPYVRPAPTGPDRERRRERERTRRRRATLRLALLALLLAGLLVAAYALGHSNGGSGAAQPVVVDCVQRVATLDKWPPAGWEKNAVIAGPVVAFVGAHDAEREEVKNGTVKTELPVLVDAERQATIQVSSGDVKLGFGDGPGSTDAVTLKACPAYYHEFGTNRKVGPFTQFIGDFEAKEPTCVELDVRVLGEADTRHVRFGLGKRCD
ncbi:MAG: hypothetical protein QOG63_1073 [Thermoleophilaceae bacterium]|jgi:hypothetical protein|nr:hypothetical protein [Thermoleophilaceae bacterium]